jgi:hypothetical protein
MTETNFDWAIVQLERHTADGVVYTAHWTLTANDNEDTASVYGSVGLEPPEEESMIPYVDLSPELVIGWVKDRIGEEQVESMESALQAQIDEKKQPSSATGLPWQN